MSSIRIARRPDLRRSAIPLLVVVALVGTLAPIAVEPAVADGTPDVTLSDVAPSSVLYGGTASVTLTASNPTATPGFNASFREVLPVGVSYLAGSTSPASAGEPTIIHDEPGLGQTTVLWLNVADIQPHSTAAIRFSLQPAVEPAADELLPGSTYTDAASVYVNTAPRTVPAFDTTGAPIAGSSTGSAASSAATMIAPITVTKSEDSPEAELPRGVHDHKATYTLTVKNSALDSTTGVTVDDYLPAGLEFLGCGGVDHTTEAAGTNPGHAVEYPGAPPLSAATTLTGPTCITPATVETLSLAGADDAPPSQPIVPGSTVYTHVVWSLPDLAPEASKTITYLAAVPLRENTASWSGTTPATTGAQGSNLDNNNGVETHDAQSLTNFAQAQGTYTGAVADGGSHQVSASTTDTVDAVDLAIQKAIVGNDDFTQGGIHHYNLSYQTSEYRYTTNAVITDTVPNGLCPLGPSNFDPDGSAECAPHAGEQPTVPYSHVAAQADGTFVVTWNLGTLATDVNATITMPSADRTDYQDGGAPSAPTVSGDALTNTVKITGTVNATCVVGTTLDPTCTAPGTVPIFSGESTPAAATNGSQAGEAASLPTLVKRVSQPVSGAVNCQTATYVTDPTEPVYQKGDTICFQLEVDFPAGTNSRNMVVTDVLPPNSAYVPDSAVALTGPTTPINTTTIASTTTPSGEVVWTLGDPNGSDLFVGPGQVFAVDLAVTATADPAVGNTFDLTANLMKVTGTNTAGDAISLRSQASYKLARPTLALLKGVAQVDGGAQNPPGTTNVLVHDGSSVTYRLDVSNSGLAPAVNGAVQDVLPTQITSCSEVSGISNSGQCSGTAPVTITWTDLPDVAPLATLTLTYTVAVPSGLVAAAVLTNTSSVTSYQGDPNNGAPPNTYTPGSGGEPAVTSTAQIHLAAPTMDKAVTTSVNESGNDTADQATIGETITYTVTAVIPAGTTVYGGAISDPLPTGQNYASGSITVNGAPDATYLLAASGNVVTATFPATVTAPLGSPTTVVLTVQAIVADVAGNTAGATSTDTANLAYNDVNGVSQTGIPASSPAVTIVEPEIAVTKTDTVSHAAPAGTAVPYVITVSNANSANVSTAHNVVVTDTLPAGMAAPTAISNSGVYTPAAGPVAATIVWTLPVLGSGGTQQLTYSAALPSPALAKSTFTNSVDVTAASLASAGARTSGTGYSAAASDTVTVDGATVTKSASPTSVTLGTDTTYTATVTIPAGTQLPNLTAIDTLPDGMTFDAYGTVTCTRSDSSPCGIDVVDNPLNIPTEDSSTGTTRLAWFIGDVNEDSLARTVTIHYTAYPALADHNGTKITAPRSLSNSIAAYWNQSAGTDPTTIPDPAGYSTASAAAVQPIAVIEPNLSIAKSASTTTPTPGVAFTYTLTITNAASNTSPAFDVVVNDPLPAGLSTPSSISNGGTFSGGVISWTIPGPIVAGTPVSRTFTTTLLSSDQFTSGQTIPNIATIASYDGVSGANDPARYRTYGPTSGTRNVTATFPALAIDKKTAAGASTGTAVIGQSFGWHVTVSDTTTAPASSVVVRDVLPAGWSYDPGSATVNGVAVGDPTISPDQLTLTFTLGSGVIVTNAQTALIAYTATPSASADLGTPDVNTASVTSAQDNTGATGNHTGPYTTGPSTASATINAADLSLAKTLASAALVPGSPTAYTLAVTNHGPSSAAGLTVVDTLPPNTSAVNGNGSGWTCSLGSGTISCTNPETLTSGSTDSSLTITLTVDSSIVADVTNDATVSSTTYDPNPANNSSELTLIPAPNADLTITKQHTGSFVAGQPGSYRIAVSNLGPSDEAGLITVTDTLPTGESYVSATGSGWTCPATVPGQTVTCTRPGPLATNANALDLTMNVAVDASVTAGSLTNAVSVDGTTPDSNSANDSASDPTAITTSADLAISKVHVGTFEAGVNGSYHIDVVNNGPSDAAGPITVSDPLPTGETFVSGSGGSNPQAWSCSADASQNVTCTLPGPLVNGDSAPPLTLTVAVDPSVTGALVNTAGVDSPTADPVSPNSSSTDSTATPLTEANLSITKTPVGSSFTAGHNGVYTLTVTNAGPSAASGDQVVTDNLPTGETFVAGTGGTAPHAWSCTAIGQVVTCTRPGPLGVATAAPITLTVALDSATLAGSITNSATVADTVTVDPDLGDNSTGTVTQPVESTATLTLAKSHTGNFTPGTNGTYTIDVANTGPSDASAPTITDPLPSGETYVSAHGADVAGHSWTCGAAAEAVTCTLDGTLPAGGSSTITLVVAVASDLTGGPVVNTATVTSGNADSVDATDTITTITPVAGLTISKAHTGDFTAGQNGSYTIVVGNTGPSDSAGPITMTDDLPAGESYVSASGTGWTCPTTVTGSTITCTLAGPLSAGSHAGVITLVVTVDASVVDRTTLTNTAATSSPTDPTGASDDDPTVIDTVADVSITKTHIGTFTPGATATYTLAVNNAGPADASGPLEVTDPLPTGLTFAALENLDPAWTCTTPTAGDGGTISCTFAGTLAAAASAPDITLDVNVLAAAYPQVTNAVTVDAPAADHDPDSSNNTSTDTASVSSVADLALSKTHTGTALAGATFSYTLAAANDGPTADPGPVTVTDMLPNGESFVRASGTGWTCPRPSASTPRLLVCTRTGEFAVDASSRITLVVRLGAAAVPGVSNTADIAGAGADPDVGNNAAADTATVIPVANLRLVKQLQSRALVHGQQARYSLQVTDEGPSPAAAPITVTDSLPAGLSYVGANSSGWACSAADQVITCTRTNTLGIAKTNTIALTVLVTATGGTITNQATVISATTQTSTSGDTSATDAIRVTASGGRAPQGLSTTGADLRTPLTWAIAFILLGGIALWAGRRKPRRS